MSAQSISRGNQRLSLRYLWLSQGAWKLHLAKPVLSFWQPPQFPLCKDREWEWASKAILCSLISLSRLHRQQIVNVLVAMDQSRRVFGSANDSCFRYRPRCRDLLRHFRQPNQCWSGFECASRLLGWRESQPHRRSWSQLRAVLSWAGLWSNCQEPNSCSGKSGGF